MALQQPVCISFDMFILKVPTIQNCRTSEIYVNFQIKIYEIKKIEQTPEPP